MVSSATGELSVPVSVGNKHQLMPFWWVASLGGSIRASSDEILTTGTDTDNCWIKQL
jgi:hypothetical protein